MQRFELIEGTSSKFWEVSVAGKALTVRFGRVGTTGQTQEKGFDTPEKAKAERDKLVREKTKKGYVEVKAAEPTAATTSRATEAPSAESAVELSRAGEPGSTATEPSAPTPSEAVDRAEGSADAPAAPARKTTRAKAPAPPTSDGFVDAGNGYALGLRDGKIVCRNAKGAVLSSVPKDLKDTDAYRSLDDVRALFAQQDRVAIDAVETWMLRSLPVPRDVLAAVWDDPSWRKALENAVVVASSDEGGAQGFFRGVRDGRVGVVDLDGETRWLDAETLRIPHPILLGELDELRALATDLSLTQGIAQLFREVHPKPAALDASATAVTDFRDGVFQQLNHALSRCRTLGYRVKGGSATCRVWEVPVGGSATAAQEARYWIGADEPTAPAHTDALTWVDERERALLLRAVSPIAWSEGVRMAAAIYAGRYVEKETNHG